jgi:glycosyltransferase involved in cell wall biosynthesis
MLETSQFDSSLFCLSGKIAEFVSEATDFKPEISVIIPCFNSQDYISVCLESLVRQTLPQFKFEVICVDDFSSDNTLPVIESYSNRINNLKIIRHDSNRKQGAARNTGLNAACGKYVLFIDSDDFFRMDALETLLHAGNSGSDVVVSQLMKVRYDTPYRPRPAWRKLEKTVRVSALKNTIGWFPVSMLIERELLNRNSIRFKENVYFEDIEFCVRTFFECEHCTVLKDHLYYYTQRDNSTVNKMTEKKLTDSAIAMASVYRFISGNHDDVSIFRDTAVSWLRLQASRIRDGKDELERRRFLGQHLVDELSRHKMVFFLGEHQSRELFNISVGNPKQSSTLEKASDITSCSPWGGRFEEDFTDKVIFFCEVDYHIRSAAPIVRELKKYEIDSIIIDASRSTSFSSNRPLRDEELPLYADIDLRPFNVAETLPFATDARAFIFMNDLTYTKRLIFENFGFGVPTFGFYEGINDDWNLDRVSPRMPYRSTDYILLPGIYQQGFYTDRECRIVGLPNVRTRLTEPYNPPVRRRAIINVNFTYGVLEDRRDEYVETAVQACKDIGLDYVITQHPADKADLSRFNVAKQSVYELLDEGTVLISRFSTTILEALATGRPVVYHNPIGEKVPKFHQPLGAYSISTSVESLRSSLKSELDFIEKGGDVRSRAALFLHFHCNSSAEDEPAVLAAKAISEVVLSPPPRFDFKVNPLASPVRDSDGTSKTSSQKVFSVGGKHNTAVSLVEANRLVRKGEFESAAYAFMKLYEMRPLKIYEDNALFAASKLGLNKLSSIEELRSKFVS